VAKKYVISTNVADLRAKPEEITPIDFSHQPLRDSQLIFGERIRVQKEEGEWLYIEALEQERYTQEEGWHPYRGWIRSSEAIEVTAFPSTNLCVIAPVTLQGIPLAFGTYLMGDSHGNVILPSGEKSFCDPRALRPFPKKLDRNLLVQDAHAFLGAPYLWGGRSSFLEEPIASVDCSGLVNLLYRAQGFLIPRDAHDQHLKAQKTDVLEPGDLVYLQKEKRVSHVIIYLGDNLFIEAPETGQRVRLIKWEKESSDIPYFQTFMC
jgi:cell wall-associated NlpC family hydrolase